MMTEQDIDIKLHPKGIKIVVNPDADKALRKPNAIQNTFTEFFNNINSVKDDINRQSRRVEILSKVIQRKLNF
jgi:glycyl-tRNA synthetase beta subunit